MTGTEIILIAILAPLGTAGIFGCFYLVSLILEWRCKVCLRDHPDNPYCCE